MIVYIAQNIHVGGLAERWEGRLVVESHPTVVVESMSADLTEIECDMICLTSPRAVRAISGYLKSVQAPVCAVGPGTAQALSHLGLKCLKAPHPYGFDALGPQIKGFKKIVVFTSDHHRQYPGTCQVVPVYMTKMCAWSSDLIRPALIAVSSSQALQVVMQWMRDQGIEVPLMVTPRMMRYMTNIKYFLMPDATINGIHKGLNIWYHRDHMPGKERWSSSS